MISLPPTFSEIKNSLTSAYKYLSKQDEAANLFVFNNKKFWDSVWIAFLVNSFAIAITLNNPGIQAIIKLLPGIKVSLYTGIFICLTHVILFSILIYYILDSIKKQNFFFNYIIPFHWLDVLYKLIGFVLIFFGFVNPQIIGVIHILLGFWVFYIFWSLGKEIGLTGIGSFGILILSKLLEQGLFVFFGYISKTFN